MIKKQIIMERRTYTYAIFAENKFVLSLSLPFQLCNMMQLTALVAYSFPEGIYSWGGFFSFYFIYYHATLIISSFYYLYINKCKTSWKQVVYAIVFICVCASIAAVVNTLTNGNYMFIGKPIIITSDLFYYAFFAVMCTTLVLFHYGIKGTSLLIDKYNWGLLLSPKENKKMKYDI
jgi:hypothetical protein